MAKLVISTCIYALVIQGCTINKREYWEAEKEKVYNCYKSWKYEDLQKEQCIKLLLFNPKHRHSMYSYPNFLIGINVEGDTIAIVDNNFDGKLDQGDLITAEPREWTEAEKVNKKPLFTVNKKSYENKLYCSISIVYYGQIKGATSTHTL